MYAPVFSDTWHGRGECDFSNPRARVRTHGFTGVAATVRSLKRAMKFSVAGVLYELWCRASNGPDLTSSRDLLIRHVSSISVEVW